MLSHHVNEPEFFPLKIALIGGTIFLGCALTSAARTAGHTVIHLNRGKSNPNADSDIQTITGDRSDPDALQSLFDLSPDVIIDTCGYSPGVVALSSDAAAAAGIPYCFISTVSVYVGWPTHSTDESSLVHPCPDDSTDTQKATQHGLLARPLSDTVTATREWLASDTRSVRWARTLTKEKEQSLLSIL